GRHGRCEPSEGLTGATASIQDAHSRRETQAVDRRPQLRLGERIEQAELARIVPLRGVPETSKTGSGSDHVGTGAQWLSGAAPVLPARCKAARAGRRVVSESA